MTYSRLHTIHRLLRSVTTALYAVALVQPAFAGSVHGRVVDGQGVSVPNAVIALQGSAPASAPAKSGTAIMDQRERQFAPHVLVVRRDTAVRFPNSDDIRHQVYSFSAAKSFSLPLYHGVPAAPIVFDKAGEVALGCNIHDRMLGFIYVVDSPWFGLTDAAGKLVIDNVPAGNYRAQLWYPGLAPNTVIEQLVSVGTSGSVAVTFSNAEREAPPAPASTSTSWGERRNRAN